MVKSALNRMPLPLVRAGAWFCVVLVGVLSWLPASMEKRTGAPGQIEHVFAYFCTAAALTLAYPRSSRLKLMVGLIVYAAVLETGQLYVPGRTAQVIDWAASGLGAVLGMVAITRLIRSQRAPAITDE
jgi:VanZ family protein